MAKPGTASADHFLRNGENCRDTFKHIAVAFLNLTRVF